MTGRTRALALAGGLILLGAPASSAHVRAIGLDEPYRYVGASTPPPTALRVTVAVRGTISGAVSATSGERGPQIVLYLPPGAVRVPGGATRVTITAAPRSAGADGLHGPTIRPGMVLGNIVDLSAITDRGSALGLRHTAQAELRLRAPVAMAPAAQIAEIAGGSARALPTQQYRRAVYAATVPRLGAYAIVADPAHYHQARRPRPAASRRTTGAVAALLVAAGGALSARSLRRRRRREG